MKIEKRRLSAILILALFTTSFALLYAIPQIPHQFYGTVSIDCAPAPDGTLVEAKIGGVTYATTTTVSGDYGYVPLFTVPADDPDVIGKEGGEVGDIIDFYVNGVWASDYTFQIGSVTQLNLIALQIIEYDIDLFEGWNLFGLPCTPEDPSIEVVLSEIIDYVEIVYIFDGETKIWLSYSPWAPSVLNEMVVGKGYWILVNTDVILTIYSESVCVPYIDFQGTIWARDGYGPAFPSPYDIYHRFLYTDGGQVTPTGSNIIIPIGLNAVIEGLELSCTESACANFYVDGHPFCTSKYIGGSFTIYLDDSEIITIEDLTMILTSDLDAQEIHGYGWAALTGVSESEGGIGLYEEFTQFSERVLITDIYSLYPLAWDDPFQYDITFRLTAASEISLFEGWNLISLPCIPEDPSIEVVLSEIIDCVECVWGFDGETETFSVYSPRAPSDLNEMVEGKGYWILMNTDAILTICVDSVCAP